jgi:hypothetical protein
LVIHDNILPGTLPGKLHSRAGRQLRLELGRREGGNELILLYGNPRSLFRWGRGETGCRNVCIGRGERHGGRSKGGERGRRRRRRQVCRLWSRSLPTGDQQKQTDGSSGRNYPIFFYHRNRQFTKT